MKKSTLIIWAIIFGVIALFIFQNQTFFMANQSLRLNLGFIEEYHTPELPIAVTFLIFFFAGIIIAYLFNFSSRFKAKRTIKKLNTALASHGTELAGLRSEIDSLKGLDAPAEGQTAASEFELAKTRKFSSDSLVADSADKTGVFSADKPADNSSAASEEESNKK